MAIFSTLQGWGATAVNTIFWIFITLALISLVGFFVYRFYSNKNYNIFCKIFSEREGMAIKYSEDRGAYLTKKDGSKAFRLKKGKTEIPHPPFNFLQPTAKGNVLFLKHTAIGEYHPVSVQEIMTKLDNIGKRSIDPELDFWATTSKERNRQKFLKPSFMEKYGGILTLALVGTIILVLVILVLRYSQSINGQMLEMARMYNQMKGTGAITSVAP